MTYAKNQHYVARLYLRQFAYEAGKNPHIVAFDKTTRRTIRPSIKNIASELDFYESSDTGIERLLGKVEDGFTPAYRRLREAQSLDAIGTEDRAVIALFLAVQLIRTAEFRAQVKSTVSHIDEWSKLHNHNLDPSYTTITEEQCRQVQISSMMTTIPGIAELMCQMKWIRLRNQTPMPFWTSDHPISFHNPRPSEITGNLGLRCRGIQVFFPLSPTLTLCLCDWMDYGALPNDLVTNDVQNVIFQNDLQVRSSTRFVFSRSSDFALATAILDEYPDVAHPDRPWSRAGGAR